MAVELIFSQESEYDTAYILAVSHISQKPEM